MSTLNERLYVSVYSSFEFIYIFNIISTCIVNVESILNQQTRWVGVIKSTNVSALYGELGKFPMKIARKIKLIKYWTKLFIKRLAFKKA